VEEGRFTLEDGRVVTITCSIGFAAFPFARREPEALGWEQIVAVADHAAYAAKRHGRNAWVGLGLTGEVMPAGKPSPEALDAWAAEGQLTGRDADRGLNEVQPTSIPRRDTDQAGFARRCKPGSARRES
jgi:hypothetical protein